jgi:hypothetical protein
MELPMLGGDVDEKIATPKKVSELDHSLRSQSFLSRN